MKKKPDLEYKKIISCIDEDFNILDKNLSEILKQNYNKLGEYFVSFIFSSSKRIRSAVIFLLFRAIYGEVTDRIYKISAGIELLHNASLIHDDIIDGASERRNRITINKKYNDKLAVIAGDFLFSLAFGILTEVNSKSNIQLYSKTLKTLCEGEIEQQFNQNKIISIDEYLKKSEYKTATLFQAGVQNVFFEIKDEKEFIELSNFAKNFGIAFQLRNDLNNIKKNTTENLLSNDFNNGIYTAAIIYASEENPDIVKSKNLYNDIKKTLGIIKTEKLISEYIKNAIANISWIEDNIYKSALIRLCRNIEEN